MSSGAEGAGDPQMGVPFAIDVNAGWRMPSTGLLCKQPPYGGIRAIDLRTGRTIWDRPLGTARRNGPWGIPSMLPINIGTPNNGGAVVTAGGLVFIAAATDNLIRAIDIETGATLWQDLLPAGGQANPLVYESGGRQYLVIMAGGHHFMGTPPGDYVIAYTLPQRWGRRQRGLLMGARACVVAAQLHGLQLRTGGGRHAGRHVDGHVGMSASGTKQTCSMR